MRKQVCWKFIYNKGKIEGKENLIPLSQGKSEFHHQFFSYFNQNSL